MISKDKIMSEGSTLQLLKDAGRPYKPFTFTYDGVEFNFFSRRISQSQALSLGRIYTQEFEKQYAEMEENGGDLFLVKRSFERQDIKKLAEFCVEADRNDFLQEASAELDDLPLDHKKVIARAEEMMKEATALLEQRGKEFVLSEAIERRAFITASIRATALQTKYVVLYSVYDQDKVPIATSLDELLELPGDMVELMLSESSKAYVTETKSDTPLKSAGSKNSRGRTSSPKPSEEESKDSSPA
jgi:hypothetical protein